MKRKRGFSFVEVLFAVFIVAMSASIVVATLPIATRSRVRADMVNKATGLAQKQLEAIRGRGYANATPQQMLSAGLIDSTTPVAANTYAFTNADNSNFDNPALILPSGVGRVRIEQIELDMRRVTVTVQWTERGTVRTVSVGTLIANL